MLWCAPDKPALDPGLPDFGAIDSLERTPLGEELRASAWSESERDELTSWCARRHGVTAALRQDADGAEYALVEKYNAFGETLEQWFLYRDGKRVSISAQPGGRVIATLPELSEALKAIGSQMVESARDTSAAAANPRTKLLSST